MSAGFRTQVANTLRELVRGVVVVRTSGALAATAVGFTRASGSFILDGWAAGMTAIPAGFPLSLSTPGNGFVVASVEPTLLRVTTALPSIPSASSRVLEAVVPRPVFGENVAVPASLAPVPGVPYTLTESWHMGSELLGAPAEDSTREDRGAFAVMLHGIVGVGEKALTDAAEAVLSRFPPGLTIPIGAESVRIRTDSPPFMSALLPISGTHVRCDVTIPWRSYRRNAFPS